MQPQPRWTTSSVFMYSEGRFPECITKILEYPSEIKGSPRAHTLQLVSFHAVRNLQIASSEQGIMNCCAKRSCPRRNHLNVDSLPNVGRQSTRRSLHESQQELCIFGEILCFSHFPEGNPQNNNRISSEKTISLPQHYSVSRQHKHRPPTEKALSSIISGRLLVLCACF